VAAGGEPTATSSLTALRVGGPPFLVKRWIGFFIPYDNGGAQSFAESAVLFFCARSKGWACDVVEAFSAWDDP
jgi:hypothetical protein